MEAYKPYIDFITAGGVAETAYILTKQGVLCGTNLPISQMPKYEHEIEDQNDPNKKSKIVVDEKNNLLQALANKGVCKNRAGIRLYNQKYFHVRNNHDQKSFNGLRSLYLKKHEGGACVCETKNFIIIGSWNQQIKMQNGVSQNPGELNKRVESLAADLLKNGS